MNKKCKFFLFFLISAALLFSSSLSAESKIAIAIHGGAGAIKKEAMSPSKIKECKAKLREAVMTGYKILQAGGSSLDAVEKTIHVLEDSPLFNAGRGSVFTNEGMNELDSSIMDGSNMKAGAVAGVKHIKNPISLARKVMEKSAHVMMAGEGAERFAETQGIKLVPSDYFYTDSRWKTLQRVKKRKRKKVAMNYIHPDHKFGTVGCAALDKAGNLAAGTSTGGMTNKKFNRIGDSPVIGAGTYADNSSCAVSCTGHGEYFIRWAVAHDISALMKYKNMGIQEAADTVIIKKLKPVGGSGGVIGVDKDGNIMMSFNTRGMYRAAVTKDGKVIVEIFEKK